LNLAVEDRAIKSGKGNSVSIITHIAKLPILVTSTSTRRGLSYTGANDYASAKNHCDKP
jgi:hypothetical protein